MVEQFRVGDTIKGEIKKILSEQSIDKVESFINVLDPIIQVFQEDLIEKENNQDLDLTPLSQEITNLQTGLQRVLMLFDKRRESVLVSF